MVRRGGGTAGSVMLDAREAPAGEMEVVLAPGDSGILLHEAVELTRRCRIVAGASMLMMRK